jgi:hypothetical protein
MRVSAASTIQPVGLLLVMLFAALFAALFVTLMMLFHQAFEAFMMLFCHC